MPEALTRIQVCSNVLRHPQVFNRLGQLAGGIGRDLVLYACWHNHPVVKLHLPDFCRLFNYNRQHLLRPVSEARQKEMLDLGLPADQLEEYNNTIGYVLVTMAACNFIFPVRDEKSQHVAIRNRKIVEEVLAVNVRKRGTYIEYKLSEEILEQNRTVYQAVDVPEYLSLDGTDYYSQDAARQMFLRCSWRRRYWDSRVAKKLPFPPTDDYDELLAIAGLHRVKSAKLAAFRLRKLLEKVGQLPSIRMTPSVEHRLGKYEVKWKRLPKHPEPQPDRYPCDPAPPEWGAAPDPGAAPPAADAEPPPAAAPPGDGEAGQPPALEQAAPPTRRNRPRRPVPPVQHNGYRPPAPPKAPAPSRAQQLSTRRKLLGELEEARGSLRWIDDPKTRVSLERNNPDQPGIFDEHRSTILRKISHLEQLLEQA